MTNTTIYQDIAQRTGGDIYIGVVGPVRTGKSTLIKRFMDTLVIPNITGNYNRERAIDELPQSASGKTIMTTEPKFIPEEAVSTALEDGATFSVRMIDCVGYIVPGAIGFIENETPRMVKTPWFDEPVPFNMAAEIGTQKVIAEHSTIGLVVTTDGSITDIPRSDYEEAEARVIRELRELRKPFLVLLNCVEPKSERAQQIRAEMVEKYGVPVVAVNCMDITENDIRDMLCDVLMAFPLREIRIKMPHWLHSLPKDHWLRAEVLGTIRAQAKTLECVRDIHTLTESLMKTDAVQNATVAEISLGTGSATVEVRLQDGLFYQILAEKTGLKINEESELFARVIEMSDIARKYEHIRSAMEQVNATGYGIVMPELSELSLEEPEMMHQGGKYGIRLRASAPSIHMMRADITTEVAPIVGSEKQSEELVQYLLSEFNEDPQKIWASNIFGKSLNELVNEGLHNKLYRMPEEARMRMKETLERMINEGCNGLICIMI